MLALGGYVEDFRTSRFRKFVVHAKEMSIFVKIFLLHNTEKHHKGAFCLQNALASEKFR